MTPPLLLDVFAPPVTYGATAEGYTAVRLRTLDEARARRCGKRECMTSTSTDPKTSDRYENN